MSKKPNNKVVAKKITSFKGETKLTKQNKAALKLLKAIKGMFG